MPFLQTDADIAGGQSGGALVSDRGDVIGFSGLIFGESAFGLAMSAPEVMARAERLLAGDDVDGVAERPVPSSGGRNDHSVSLDNYWDEAAYVLEAPYGTLAELAVESGEDAVLAVISPYGDLEVEADETSGGIEQGSFVTRDAGPYFVVANLDRAGDLTLESSEPVVPIVDPDDGAELQLGRPTVALMDYPGDFDHFRLVLAKGQPVVVSVDTLSFSPELIIDSPGDGGTPPGVDTSVGGALGLTATAAFIADVSGTYYIVVNDVEGVGTGGYLLTVE